MTKILPALYHCNLYAMLLHSKCSFIFQHAMTRVYWSSHSDRRVNDRSIVVGTGAGIIVVVAVVIHVSFLITF